MSPFVGLKVYTNIDLNLIESDVNKAIIYGENSEFVVLSSKDGILKIRVSGGNILSSGRTKIDLYYSKQLNFIGAYQGSIIHSIFPINQSSVRLVSKGNSKIDLDVYCNVLDTSVSFSGRVYLKGKVKNHTLFYGTSGICEADKLVTNQTKTKSYGGAYAYINADSLIEANLVGGKLRIFGRPLKSITQQVFGAKIITEK
tara:strand:+ start:332 stop:931 length:600 start_codon:yes stop_codon:yes gene_type:complete